MSKECLIFFAPYGSCKTATVCDGCAELIQYSAQLYASGNSRKNKKGKPMIPVVVLAFTESDKAEYRNRLMAHLGRIPWKRLREMNSLSDLDDSGKPASSDSTSYESKEFADKLAKDKENVTWKSEAKRVAEATLVANRHLMLLDCTDSDDDNPHIIGGGGMEQVAAVVRSLFASRSESHYPIMLWLDHLSGLVDRMTELDEAERRVVLTRMPLIAVERIGKHFDCPLVLMHQFAGSAQNKGITAKYHHSDAEGSKSIGKYANFCVVSGKADENMMCVWEATKHRREPPTGYRIVRVDGDFSRLRDCSKTHGIEPGRNVILTKEEMNMAGVSVSKKKGGTGFLLNNMPSVE
jgi:hypothetical protein